METPEQAPECEGVELHGTNAEPEEAPPVGVEDGVVEVVVVATL